MALHYANLTRGLLCPHLTGGKIEPRDVRLLRIQSTACEQKRWGYILDTVGADILYRLAQGDVCIVHDRSERPRETRACWQGLSWIRYACQRGWAADHVNPLGRVPRPEYSRTGHPLNAYWETVWADLDRKTRHHMTYFGKFRQPTVMYPYLVSCGSCEGSDARRYSA